MPVFISHRTADDKRAHAIRDRLVNIHRIQCYLDHLDPVAQSTNQITKVILDALEKCTHLVAVISENTRGSWWVPYEIGVAQRGSRRITSFNDADVELPEYLEEWPILASDKGIDLFAEAYKADGLANSMQGKSVLNETELRLQSLVADNFHLTLKHALGQR